MHPPNAICFFALAVSLMFVLTGCQKKGEDYTVKERNYEGLQRVELTPSSPDPVPAQPLPHGPSKGPEWVVIENVSNVAKAVLKEMQQATKDGKKLVVYVGARWCKPCKDFDTAAKQPDFGSEIDHIRLMKFDWDRHQTALNRANYGSQYLPLFVLPGPDGKGSKERFFGGRFKGKAGVADLKKRLAELVAKR